MALPLIAFMLRRLTDIMSTLSARSRTAARPRTLNMHILCLWKKPGETIGEERLQNDCIVFFFINASSEKSNLVYC